MEKDRKKRPDIVTIIHRLRETENLINKLKSDLLDKVIKLLIGIYNFIFFFSFHHERQGIKAIFGPNKEPGK